MDGLWNVINALGGVLPDRSVPALRADRNVEYVEDLGQIVFFLQRVSRNRPTSSVPGTPTCPRIDGNVLRSCPGFVDW